MYKLTLILKYLRKRRIAWVSLIAVMLCTAMVIVVISVMGGWLSMFRASFRGLLSDVIVSSRSREGFPNYEMMLERIRKLPEVSAAEPVITTGGFLHLLNQQVQVGIVGLRLESIGQVNSFPQSLNRTKGNPSFGLIQDIPYEKLIASKNKNVANSVRHWPGMIVGYSVLGIRVNPDGTLRDPSMWYTQPARLFVAAAGANETGIDASDLKDMPVWIVDVSRTGNWQYDNKCVYVPFADLQRNLKMEAFENEPARTSEIQVRAKEGVNLDSLRDKVEQIVIDVRQETKMGPKYPMDVETWEEGERAHFIRAVEKEKVMMTILFGIISVVAVFLIFCIFYMIVVEKTRDIGIIKSVGATSTGVAGIFLGYGLAIGIVGAGLGFAAGWAIVHWINEIHAWLGRTMGVQMWDANTYVFDRIPNTVNPREIGLILLVAIAASVLGAVIPAIRAARLHPVEALRWE